MEAAVERHIDARPEAVAKLMFDPMRDPEWIGGARSVDSPVGDPTETGARADRHGGFLGRKFSWTTEVVKHIPDHLLEMRFVAGPMKGGGVTYRIDPEGKGSRVSIRNTGPGPEFMSWFVRRSVAKDLDRLAELVRRD